MRVFRYWVYQKAKFPAAFLRAVYIIILYVCLTLADALVDYITLAHVWTIKPGKAMCEGGVQA